MLVLTKHIQAADASEVADVESLHPLSLSIDDRVKSRFLTQLANGTEVRLFLPRGRILRHGDVLESEFGERVRVEAAAEPVSTVYCQDLHLLARVAYHLGNRHVPLQISPEWVRYQTDHVLDAMVEGLGAKVTAESAPFEPEDGAYGGAHGGHHGSSRNHQRHQENSDNSNHGTNRESVHESSQNSHHHH